MKTKNETWFSYHSLVWIGIISVLLLMTLFVLRAPVKMVFTYSLVFLLILFGFWLLLPDKFLKKFRKKNLSREYDFGWTPKFLKGFGYASFIAIILAFYSWYALGNKPILQILTFTLLLLLASNFFIGNIIARASQSKLGMVLPFTDLFTTGKDKVLDVGCGAGRTTISLSKTAPDLKIIALDRFDALYIEKGGIALLKQNLELAGITSKVTIEQGDVTAMPFIEEYIDAAVSAYMFDHLGKNKLKALNEMWRILKPGGRFLLVLIVRGYSSFGLANVLSFAFETRNFWRKLFKESRFVLVDEGNINFGAYFLIEKPLKQSKNAIG